jgi:hypothetical protein
MNDTRASAASPGKEGGLIDHDHTGARFKLTPLGRKMVAALIKP